MRENRCHGINILRIVTIFIFFILLLSIFISPLYSEQDLKDNITPLLKYRLPKNVELCGERIPIERPEIYERLDLEFLLFLGNEAQIILWLKRSKKFFPYIEERLKEEEMPDDLKYIPVVESSLRNDAVSRKGAAGTWQFIPETSKRYGLTKNRSIDERFDFFKATEGALAYLRELYDQFGSWILAMAAYNCGEERLSKEIKEQGVNNYFNLYLPRETERYVFRIAAIKLILSNPERYGFIIDEADFYPPLKFQTIVIKVKYPIHLRLIAEAANTYFKNIKELNPQIRGYYLPAGKQLLRIPPGDLDKFIKKYKRITRLKKKKGKKHYYRVKSGDTLYSIASKLNISTKELIKYNHIKKGKKLKKGKVLVYYKYIIE
ncbi:MAG: transglycosylase SLT domain-containing protein [Deltaproteobacteria bacterium]|nr:transglycosylase SLT domain-containing protein [Deltaproteobacteria bacterium]